MPRPSKNQCIYCHGTGQIRDRGIFETCHNCAGTGSGLIKLVELPTAKLQGGTAGVRIDPPTESVYTPKAAMESTLRYTAHHEVTKKNLAEFVAQIPDDAKIRVRVDVPHQLDGGTTTTTFEAHWTSRHA